MSSKSKSLFLSTIVSKIQKEEFDMNCNAAEPIKMAIFSRQLKIPHHEAHKIFIAKHLAYN